MMHDIVTGPSSDNGDDGEPGQKPGSYVANVANIENYHESDLRHIAEIAKINPELAEKTLASQERRDIRTHASERLGLVLSIGFATILFLGTIVFVIFIGVLGSIGFVLSMLATAFFLRVALTGEWSDTKFFSSAIDSILKKLSDSEPKKEDDTK